MIKVNLSVKWAWIFVVAILSAIQVTTNQADAAEWMRIRWVNDGDTVVLADGRHLRYLGINTPEIDYKRHQAEPYAYAARRFNRKMVDDNKIRLEFEKKKTDRYGRLLAYVFLEDKTFVNRELLARGYGYFYPSAQAGTYDDLLLKAQSKAMASQIGIWRDWKEPKKSDGYIGNRRSKRFHLADCPNGKQVSRKNRFRFETMWEAFFKGYAPAKRCIIDKSD